MKDSTRRAAEELMRCSAMLRDCTNQLFWAQNPEEDFSVNGSKPLTVEEAYENQSQAYRACERAEYYMEKELRNEQQEAEKSEPREPQATDGTTVSA